MLVSSLCRKGECIERAGGCAEMSLGEMQIDGSYFEVAMTEQDLDGAQVGYCFQQVGGEAVRSVWRWMCLCAKPTRSAAF